MQTTAFWSTQLTTQELNLPSTQDSLKQHVLRPVYQAAFILAQSLIPVQNLQSPDEWGWNKQRNNSLSCWMM